jgi:lipoprotein-anchoring transpeptidase ErfK/SrfK
MTELDRLEALRALEKAWALLSQGQRKPARDLAMHAARLNPGAEGPLLILAALGSPEESIHYLEKVLEINPDNQRALQGLQWARKRVRKQNEHQVPTPQATRLPVSTAQDFPAPLPTSQSGLSGYDDLERRLIVEGFSNGRLEETRPVQITPAAVKPSEPTPEKKEQTQPVSIKKKQKKGGSRPKAAPGQGKPPPSRGRIIAAMAVGLMLCLFLSAAVMIPYSNLFFPSLVSAGSSGNVVIPVFSTFTNEPGSSLQNEQSALELSRTDLPPATLLAITTPTGLPTITYAPSFTPPASATPVPTQAPTMTSSPPPTVVAIPVQQSEMQTVNHAFTGRWIDVDLNNQMVYAYEDDTIVREFLVSTGTAAHPTVKGQFHIYLKFRYDDMVGPGYYLRDVPYVMYFYKGYGLHGTFWHDNFGTPMSHGCVNMRTDEAAWLYDFAPMGTLVNVH